MSSDNIEYVQRCSERWSDNAAPQKAYGLDRYSWNQGYNAKYDFQIFEDEEPALVARGGSAVCCPKKSRSETE